jgi:hypothetical protein
VCCACSDEFHGDASFAAGVPVSAKPIVRCAAFCSSVDFPVL